MANTIKIKRRPASGAAGKPSSLLNGELAFNENDNILYYGHGSGVGGAASTIEQIGGSGYFAHRGGINASGTWPISIDGTAAYATNAVYTTGNQNISGTKIFYNGNNTTLAIATAHDGTGTLIFFDGNSFHSSYFEWDGDNHNLSFDSVMPSANFIMQKPFKYKVPSTGTVATSVPVFTGGNPSSSAETITARSIVDFKSDLALSNVTNDIQVKQTTGGTTVGYLPTWNSTSGDLLATGYAVSTNLVTNSGSTHIPRADSVVNYVSSGLANHAHGNITNDGKIGSTANLPLITTTSGTITTGSFGSTANTFCQGNDSRLSDTRNTTNSITVNNSGAGDSSSFTFNGSAAKTISYNSIGAPSQTGALASGSNWNISILGNSATVTNGVYTSRTLNAGSGLVGGGDLSSDRTFNIGQGDGMSISADSIAVDNTVVRTTGDQAIGGKKIFSNITTISGNLSPLLLFKSLNAGNYANIIFDGVNYDGDVQSSYIISNTGNMEIAHGQKIQLNSALEVKAANTSGNSVSYFAVFDSNPDSSLTTLKSVSKDQILDDIGAATSGLDITAGSGLVGGGTLSQNRRFDIGQGDGITVSTDSIAVDSTVVRTAGTQTIAGVKTISDRPVLNSGLSVLMASTASSGLFFPVFTSDPSSAAQALASRTPSQVKGDIGLSNVTNDAQVKKLASTSGGYVPTWNGTTGDALNVGYSVETTLTGGTGALPRADAVKTYVDNMITSGIATNDAMIFKGSIDCSTNPNYPAADRGWTYKVSVAGKIGGASGPTVEVNDTLICTTDSTSSGTHAAVGSNWVILQTNIVDASILVTGPASATSGNFALFDGTTGKIIKDAGFAATTVGQNLVSLTNPSATTFIKVNSNNTVSTESASTFRTSLGANTVGSNIFTLANPSSISFIRINSDNTVTARSSSELKTDLSLNNVENTALSTWAGSTNITTLGTIASGTWSATTIAVNKGGTGQTSYTDGQLLIGNSTGNTLTKATITEGTGIDIANGNGSITITHEDTSTLTGAQGSNGIASITVDGLGHVTAVTTATYLTAGTVCAAIVDCALDGGSF